MTNEERKVIELALEALENSVDLVVNDAYNAEQLYGNYPTRQGKVGGLKVLAEQHKQAITAIKEALAQPEQWGASAVTHPEYIDEQKAKTQELRSMLAQPEQEPVEWGVDWGKDGNSVSIIKRLADGSIEVLGWEYAPHPPQRTWVGLTDSEIGTIAYNVNPLDGIRQFSRAIEAKLKEKNT